MELLCLLLCAHLISHFYLPLNSWVNNKKARHIKSVTLWKHTSLYTCLNAAVFILLQTAWLPALIWLCLLSVSYLLINHWSSYKTNTLSHFLIEQSLYILIIIIAWVAITDITFMQLVKLTISNLTAKNITIAIAYILVCKPASVLISLALKKHTAQQSKPGLISAGAWIGYIERCLTLTFIFMGQFAGIGFLVATKTMFRFGDLTKNKDMQLTEYMMLGTLLSYTIAIIVGWCSLSFYLMK